MSSLLLHSVLINHSFDYMIKRETQASRKYGRLYSNLHMSVIRLIFLSDLFWFVEQIFKSKSNISLESDLLSLGVFFLHWMKKIIEKQFEHHEENEGAPRAVQMLQIALYYLYHKQSDTARSCAWLFCDLHTSSRGPKSFFYWAWKCAICMVLYGPFAEVLLICFQS